MHAQRVHRFFLTVRECNVATMFANTSLSTNSVKIKAECVGYTDIRLNKNHKWHEY